MRGKRSKGWGKEGTYLTSGVDDLTIVIDTIVHDMFTFRLFDSREVSLDISRWLDILSSQRRLSYTISLDLTRREIAFDAMKEEHTNTRCTKDDDLSLHLFRRHSFNLIISLGLGLAKVESGSEEDMFHFIDDDFVLFSVSVFIFVFVFVFRDGLKWVWLIRLAW